MRIGIAWAQFVFVFVVGAVAGVGVGVVWFVSTKNEKSCVAIL